MSYSMIAEPKDYKRLEDIKTKSQDDIDKAISLAKSMANKITDRDKCSRRIIAADKVFGVNSQISEIFTQRFNELNPIEIKRGEFIDKILKAFDYRNTGYFIQENSLCKIEMCEGKIFYHEPKHQSSNIINEFAESKNIPRLSEMWIYRHAFEPYDKTDSTDTIIFEFTL